MEKESLGLIETVGLVPAIEAADAGSKAANVLFRGMQQARAGLITVMFVGDVAAVRAAVAAGAAAGRLVGNVVSVHVIARPDRQLRVTPNGSTPARRVISEPKAEEPAKPKAIAIKVFEKDPAPVEEVIVVEALAQEYVEPEAPPEVIAVEVVEVAPAEDPRPAVEAIAIDEEPEVVSVCRATTPQKKEKVRKPKSKRKF